MSINVTKKKKAIASFGCNRILYRSIFQICARICASKQTVCSLDAIIAAHLRAFEYNRVVTDVGAKRSPDQRRSRETGPGCHVWDLSQREHLA